MRQQGEAPAFKQPFNATMKPQPMLHRAWRMHSHPHADKARRFHIHGLFTRRLLIHQFLVHEFFAYELFIYEKAFQQLHRVHQLVCDRTRLIRIVRVIFQDVRILTQGDATSGGAGNNSIHAIQPRIQAVNHPAHPRHTRLLCGQMIVKRTAATFIDHFAGLPDSGKNMLQGSNHIRCGAGLYTTAQ